MKSARIFDIYRGTSHDGPGLRTTIFFQGCPLSCKWCHNPEGISRVNRVWWDQNACIGCMHCVHSCSRGAIDPGDKQITIQPERCVLCGTCVQSCPTGAMSLVGKSWTLEDLVHEALKDRVYYKKTRGGVTASGGECLLQVDFLTSFLQKMIENGIDTAIDTCGHVPWSSFEMVLPYTNHVLLDLKLADSNQHRFFTGQNNELILKNAVLLDKYIQDKKGACDVWIRTPLIPGATDTKQNLTSIAAFIREKMSHSVVRWELPAFNNSCTKKYQRLNQDWLYKDVPLLSKQACQELREVCCSSGLPDDAIVVTGLFKSTDI